MLFSGFPHKHVFNFLLTLNHIPESMYFCDLTSASGALQQNITLRHNMSDKKPEWNLLSVAN